MLDCNRLSFSKIRMILEFLYYEMISFLVEFCLEVTISMVVTLGSRQGPKIIQMRTKLNEVACFADKLFRLNQDVLSSISNGRPISKGTKSKLYRLVTESTVSSDPS